MRRKIFYLLVCLVAAGAVLTGCESARQPSAAEESSIPAETAEAEASEVMETAETPEVTETAETDEPAETESSEEENVQMKMHVEVGGSTFTATLADNEAARMLAERMAEGPLTIQMSDYAGFEKVGALGASLPTDNHQTTTQAGDIVLYQGNQIVIFYGSNSWSYTRLGKIDDLSGWEEALGNGDVTVTFSLGD